MGSDASLFRAGSAIELHAKSGKPLGRYFPEIEAVLRDLPVDRFVLDGELVIPAGETLSFDSLQMRLHPAESRIRKLSRRLRQGSSCSTACSTGMAAVFSTARSAFAARCLRNSTLPPETARTCGCRLIRSTVGSPRNGSAGLAGRSTGSSRSAATGPIFPRTGDDQGQAVVHRRLRGRRIPLSEGLGRTRSLLLGLYNSEENSIMSVYSAFSGAERAKLMSGSSR